MSYRAEARSAAMTAELYCQTLKYCSTRILLNLDIPTKVPVEAIRKARNGTVRARKEW